jgi:hypothetical protein
MALSSAVSKLPGPAVTQLQSPPQFGDLTKHVDAITSQLGEITTQLHNLSTQVKDLGIALRPPTGMQTADIIQIGLLIVAILAFCAAAYTFREAKNGRDLENYLTIVEKLDAYWDRLNQAAPQNQYDEFLKVVNFLESICHCYNKKLFNRATGEMLKQYLSEMIPPLYAPGTAVWMKQAVTSAQTFSEIKRFAKRYDLPSVP